MAVRPDHGFVGNVCLIEDGWVLTDESQLLVETFASDLGMDINWRSHYTQCTANQQLSELEAAVFRENCDPLQLGAFVSSPDTQSTGCIITDEQQDMTTVGVLAVEVDSFINTLFFYEDRAPYLLTEREVGAVGGKAGSTSFQIDDSLFHSVHNTEKKCTDARALENHIGIGRFSNHSGNKKGCIAVVLQESGRKHCIRILAECLAYDRSMPSSETTQDNPS